MPSAASLDRDPLAVVVPIEHAAQVTGFDLELAGELRLTILEKTARVVDIEGSAFAPYAKTYAKTRTKSGRKASPVELLWSGKMLAALRIVVNRALNEVALVIYGEEAVRAAAHNSGVPGSTLSTLARCN